MLGRQACDNSHSVVACAPGRLSFANSCAAAARVIMPGAQNRWTAAPRPGAVAEILATRPPPEGQLPSIVLQEHIENVIHVGGTLRLLLDQVAIATTHGAALDPHLLMLLLLTEHRVRRRLMLRVHVRVRSAAGARTAHQRAALHTGVRARRAASGRIL